LFNNMAETIMAGKDYPDTYFMEGAKILQPELPLPLMVHARAPRWTVTAEKSRPLEMRVHDNGRIHIRVRFSGLKVGDEAWKTPVVVDVSYRLTQDAYGEYQ